ncbi:MAG: excinuclease ABC subunit UvrC [Deltaproteobacteria bacterium]|nr:excinuclease ABC subunit UvrC [Deltaproteobacteria bacterium]
MSEIQFDSFPESPGCYLMKNKAGKIFYVGKAINLRNRIRSYFTGQDTRAFVGWLDKILDKIDVVVVESNKEALLLEQTLIQLHKPKYNILLKDDKRFISLRLAKPKESGALHDQFPKLEIIRKPKKDNARYFGPYPSATKLRETVTQINKHFKLRTCSDRVIDHRDRPCIQHQIGRCLAPCVYPVPVYEQEMDNVAMFLKGQTSEVEKQLEQLMWNAVQSEQFERAAQIRDQIQAIEDSVEKQTAYRLSKRHDEDVFGVAREAGYLEIVRLPIRAGRMQGAEHYGFQNQEFPTDELLSGFISQFYANLPEQDWPKQVASPYPPFEKGGQGGFPPPVSTPKRGELLKLVNIATQNAELALEGRLKQAESHLENLKALQACVGMRRLPKTIECFDVSLFQGTDAVASQVCFVNGVPDKSRYRKYNIKTVEGTDDYAMMREVLTRRLKKADFPDLLLVDGGKGQLSVAMAVCRDLGLDLTLAAIAKAPERLFLPNRKNPIVLKEHTKERYLLERIRDEAHRFAITAHRAKRKKRILSSRP